VIAVIGAAAAWPVAVRAQQARQLRRLGVLVTTGENDPEWRTERSAFLEAMQSLGWADGANLRIDYRFAAGDRDRLAASGKELVALKPDVLIARSTTAVRALLAETRTIPIVFVSVSDPVGEKFASSLARPGGNATGFTNVEATMGGKWLELLKEVAPHLRRVGILFNPQVAVAGGSFFLPPIKAAAPAFALTLDILPVHSVGEMEEAVTALAREPNSALVVPPDVFILANRVHRTNSAALSASISAALREFQKSICRSGSQPAAWEVAPLQDPAGRLARHLDGLLAVIAEEAVCRLKQQPAVREVTPL
jgi:putative tryptophan/tyrosine transport system substrate-binding protein